MRTGALVLVFVCNFACRSDVQPGPATRAAGPASRAATTIATTKRARSEGSTPLIDAVLKGKPAAQILEMVAAGADVNDRGGGRSTVLYYAASMPDFREFGNHQVRHEPMLPVVKALVERGADVNARCIGGFTP